MSLNGSKSCKKRAECQNTHSHGSISLGFSEIQKNVARWELMSVILSSKRDAVPSIQVQDFSRFIGSCDLTAFLSPKIQATILDSTQPPELTLKRLVSVTHAIDWAEQECRSTFDTSRTGLPDTGFALLDPWEQFPAPPFWEFAA
ncbi:hypothetical protein [Ruegeria faecimaris]|uniref:hypothetical protein n=1 Tax=Ruegeria faecimaris TaxID=686389 RepID=UPI00232E58BD|nr:hypothetical protein [Ruegeria faecimaris]